MLEARRNQYKAAALNAKHAGDINTAKRYVQNCCLKCPNICIKRKTTFNLG
jgi:hypothetical protein